MHFKDTFPNMYGYLQIEKRDAITNELIETVDVGKNAITYRAKAIMSRIMGAGLSGALDPSTGSSFNWGSGGAAGSLRVTGVAVGNGGHLIYNTGNDNKVLTKNGGTLQLAGTVNHDITQPAMPQIGGGADWGYASNSGQQIPGASYEKVENGNIPWDGSVTIQDNEIGVDEAGSTLYSETFRFPLDIDGPDNDGIRFISPTEVQFKATLPAQYVNATDDWGFANTQANYISEAGLIVGYCPGTGGDVASKVSLINEGRDLTNGQLYSTDGNEPTSSGQFANWADKDYSNAGGPSFDWGTKPASSHSPDQWTGGENVPNNWNLFSRKTFPALVNQPSFSLVFLWTIGF